MKKILALFIGLSFWAAESRAQTHSNFYLAAAVPIGDFAQNTNAFGFGGGGNILFAVGDDDSPVFIGPEITYLIYGRNSESFGAGSGLFSRNLRLRTNNNMLLGGGVFRIKPPLEGPIQIFVEGVGGLNYIYTRSVLKDDNDWDDNGSDVLEADLNFYDTAYYYGGGGGFLFMQGPFKLLASARYLKGTEAEYLDRQSVTINGPNPKDVSYFTKRSATDMIQIQIGASISF